jgi:hypothetical protein
MSPLFERPDLLRRTKIKPVPLLTRMEPRKAL